MPRSEKRDNVIRLFGDFRLVGASSRPVALTIVRRLVPLARTSDPRGSCRCVTPITAFLSSTFSPSSSLPLFPRSYELQAVPESSLLTARLSKLWTTGDQMKRFPRCWRQNTKLKRGEKGLSSRLVDIYSTRSVLLRSARQRERDFFSRLKSFSVFAAAITERHPTCVV